MLSEVIFCTSNLNPYPLVKVGSTLSSALRGSSPGRDPPRANGPQRRLVRAMGGVEGLLCLGRFPMCFSGNVMYFNLGGRPFVAVYT